MCGIAGIIGDRRVNSDAVEHMNTLQEHRGPDDSGIWKSANGSVVLGHQRLSIIDISTAGHQPMEIGSQVITYNGEIYNFSKLRKQLSSLGSRFKSNSDTEVILEAYKKWGIDCLLYLEGMFSFVIFDKKKDQILAVRDRLGIKPLHYTILKDKILISSEVKSIIFMHYYGLIETVKKKFRMY